MKNITANVEIAAMIAESRDMLRDEMRSAVMSQSRAIMEQLAAIAEIASRDYAGFYEMSIIWGICSGNEEFVSSVLQAQAAHECYRAGIWDQPAIYDAIRARAGKGSVSMGQHSRALAQLFPTLAEIVRHRSYTRDFAVKSISGLAHKTASLTQHMIDPTAHVYTLDRHMLKHASRIAGVANWNKVTTANKTAYVAIENLFIEIHHELFGNTLPIFVSQWALWERWGFENGSVDHASIYSTI